MDVNHVGKEEAVVIQDERWKCFGHQSLDCGCWFEHDPCNIQGKMGSRVGTNTISQFPCYSNKIGTRTLEEY